MQPDSHWLAFAHNDLHTAEVLLREGIWNQVCFHSQQAVEKILKSCIQPENRPRTHKIADLLEHCEYPLNEDLKLELLLLDRFYIPTRYPDALPGSFEKGMPNESDAKQSYESADKLHKLALTYR